MGLEHIIPPDPKDHTWLLQKKKFQPILYVLGELQKKIRTEGMAGNHKNLRSKLMSNLGVTFQIYI
jgi:hypothetical protein